MKHLDGLTLPCHCFIVRINRALLIATAVLVSPVALAQGTFNFNNLYYASGVLPGVSAPFYYCPFADGGSPAALDTNFYVTVLGGSLPGANGVNIAGRTIGDMAPLKMAASGSTNVLKTFRTGANAGFISGGGTVFYQPVAAGTAIAVQVVAWSKNLGPDIFTAFAAWQLGNGAFGASDVMQITLAVSSDPNQPRLAPSGGVGVDPTKCATPGLSSFTMCPIGPEPSVLALLGLGLGGAVLFRHRG